MHGAARRATRRLVPWSMPRPRTCDWRRYSVVVDLRQRSLVTQNHLQTRRRCKSSCSGLLLRGPHPRAGTWSCKAAAASRRRNYKTRAIILFMAWHWRWAIEAAAYTQLAHVVCCISPTCLCRRGIAAALWRPALGVFEVISRGRQTFSGQGFIHAKRLYLNVEEAV
jgi:hypothetical protein